MNDIRQEASCCCGGINHRAFIKVERHTRAQERLQRHQSILEGKVQINLQKTPGANIRWLNENRPLGFPKVG